MSKTVHGYVIIEGVTYSEIAQNPVPCVEALLLAQEAGLIPADLNIYAGSTRMYDGTEVEGVIIQGKSKTQTMAITKHGVVYDDMMNAQTRNKILEVLQTYVPANYKLEQMKKKIKGVPINAKKKISGTKICLEVELA
jgi:hypothetical protein